MGPHGGRQGIDGGGSLWHAIYVSLSSKKHIFMFVNSRRSQHASMPEKDGKNGLQRLCSKRWQLLFLMNYRLLFR
jgi:hypothetical protein